MSKKSLLKYTYLSIFASLVVISLKILAFFLTKSVGFLSDAIESLVNVICAFTAYLMLKLAEKPADKTHPYGHTKAEYFSSLFEAVMIFVASLSIIFSAIQRIIHPQLLEKVSIGLFVSFLATAINFLTAKILISVGKKNQSITLEADGHHLMTDVLTSVGVIVAVFLINQTGFLILDPLVAIFVALNILLTATSLIKRSVSGFLDEALDEKDLNEIKNIFAKYEKKGIKFHSIKSRQSAQKKFLSFHILFPNHWSIKKAHDLADKIEKQIKKNLENAEIESHLEPINDKKSFEN
ncbi:MAG: cation diffusion facilitator family transporter [Microgenomates group bacterium]